jgi:predicted nuclease of predicted toxin-antitoxin system
LIIITKDADFSLKALYKGVPPKVIHLKFGNLKIQDFHVFIANHWEIIEMCIAENSLINVYIDKIESIK